MELAVLYLNLNLMNLIELQCNKLDKVNTCIIHDLKILDLNFTTVTCPSKKIIFSCKI